METIREALDKVKELYSLPPFILPAPTVNKKEQMVQCQLLMEEMESRGALEKEKHDLLLYMTVLVYAQKERLDWERAREDLKIDDLFNFYIY